MSGGWVVVAPSTSRPAILSLIRQENKATNKEQTKKFQNIISTQLESFSKNWNSPPHNLQRKSNADLAQNVVQLKNFSIEKNYLEVSIKSLEITIKTMGRVRTIFENTRLFWLQIKAQCDSLSDVSNIKDLAEVAELSVIYQTDFTNQIK
ncbi:hypothetical protein ACTFIT_007311 [Dictyostelium discoideum]